MRGRQTLSEFLPRGRKSVEGLVSRRPKSIASGIVGGSNDLQHRVVGWDWLEGDAEATVSLEPELLRDRTYSECHPELASRFVVGPARPLYIFLFCSEDMTVTSSSTLPSLSTASPRLPFERGCLCRKDESGLPVSCPILIARVFWSQISRSWLRRNTTPR